MPHCFSVSTAWFGALGALLLLLAFVGGIAYDISKGRNPDCHCFGSLHSEPAGWSTLIRNSVLSVIALFVLISGPDDTGHSLIGWIGDLCAGEIILGIFAIIALIAVAAEGWLLVHLLGQNGRVLLRLDALETMISEGNFVKLPSRAGSSRPEGSRSWIAGRNSRSEFPARRYPR